MPLSTLHMMTSSHSLFLPTMLDSDEEPSRCQAKGMETGGKHSFTNLKPRVSLVISLLFIIDHKHTYFVIISEALVSLLLCLVKKCPTVCNVNHFVVLLGAYGATLSTTGKRGNLGIFVSCLSFPLHAVFCFIDQKLLLLLQEYERNSVSLLKFQ